LQMSRRTPCTCPEPAHCRGRCISEP
jgi:hypothetical protein